MILHHTQRMKVVDFHANRPSVSRIHTRWLSFTTLRDILRIKKMCAADFVFVTVTDTALSKGGLSMKKLLSMLFVVALLCGCIGCSSKPNQAQPYLLPDRSKSESYNTAIAAYNEFLNGIIAAQSDTKFIYINEMENSSLQSGINRFALFDMNKDGTPELHTEGHSYTIFSIRDGNVVQVYENDAGFDSHFLLKKPALMSIKNSTGTTYRYTTIDSMLVSTTIEFFDPESDSANAPYYFNNVTVTKKQYDMLSKVYLELLQDPATVQWYTYTR